MVEETRQQMRTKQLVDSEETSFAIRAREDETLSFAIFLKILSQGKRTIFFSGLDMLVLAAILAFVLPATYSSTASFVPPGANGPQSSAALMGQLSALGGAGLLGGKSQGDLYVGILKSHTLARYIVDRYGLEKVYKVKKESQAEKILSANSIFEVGSKDPIVTITVTDRSAERARDLANGYLQGLQATSAELALTESSQRRLFYEDRLSKEKNALADAEVALKQAEEKTGLISPGGQTNSQIQSLAQLDSQITIRKAQLAGLLLHEADENPDVLRLRGEIGSLEAQVKQMQTGNSRDSYGQFSTAQVPGMELEYIRRARDVKYHETLFDIIAKQYESARLDEARDSPLQILDHPTVPDTKSGPHRTIIMGIGMLVGLLGGMAWVLMKHAKDPNLLHV